MDMKISDLENLPKGELINLVKRGIVRISMDIPFTAISAMTKHETPEYQRYSHLRGQPINISAASRKYDIPDRTIGRWVSRGYIARIGMDKNRVLIDEADVAYCAFVYHQRPGQGQRIFNPDGTPYTSR